MDGLDDHCVELDHQALRQVKSLQLSQEEHCLLCFLGNGDRVPLPLHILVPRNLSDFTVETTSANFRIFTPGSWRHSHVCQEFHDPLADGIWHRQLGQFGLLYHYGVECQKQSSSPQTEL